jgi:signal transduction histidine kinase/CheY-like chemotaxis protein
MNIYSLVSLAASFVFLYTGAAALSKNPRGAVQRIFFLFCLFGAYWAFTEYSIRRADTFAEAYAWLKIGAFRPFIVSFLVHFAALYTRRPDPQDRPWMPALIHAPALIFSFVNLFTDWIKGTPVKTYWGWSFGQNGFAPARYTFFVVCFCAALYLLYVSITEYRRLSPVQRHSYRLTLPALLFLMTAGLVAHCLECIGSVQIPETTSIFALGIALTVFVGAVRYSVLVSPAVAADTILDAMDEFVAVADTRNRILWANRAFCDATGYHPCALSGQDIGVVLNNAPPARGVSKRPDGLLDARAETNIVSRTGDAIPTLLTTRTIERPDGALLATAYLGCDLRLWKKTEEHLRKSQRLEALELNVRSIAHDFNNLLTAAAGNLSLARLSRDIDYIHAHIGAAQEAVMLSGELIERFSAISRDHPPRVRSCAVADLIERTLAISIRSSTIRVTKRIDPGLPAVMADKNQMLQALTNICINARQAMDDHGALTVSARLVAAADNRAESQIALSIEDTGPGIEPERLNRVFDPFYTTRESGSGLGLAITRSIVEAHGGAIRIDSRPGVGTSVTISLPTADTTDTAAPPHHADSPGITKALVLERDPLVRHTIADILAEGGCAVEAVGEAGEAIQRLIEARAAGAPFEAALVEQTAGGSGDGVARRFAAIAPDLPLILLTAAATTSTGAECAMTCRTTTIKKPFTAQELFRALRDATRGATV